MSAEFQRGLRLRRSLLVEVNNSTYYDDDNDTETDTMMGFVNEVDSDCG